MDTENRIAISPRPPVDDTLAARIGRELFGAEGPVRELGSSQDRNFRIDTAAGPRVLKVANRSWGRDTLEAQHAAMRHLARKDPGLKAPVPFADAAGVEIREYPVGDDRLLVRLLSYVEGRPLTGVGYLAPEVITDLGEVSGRTCAALADFDHPGLERVVQWDLRHAEEVIARLHPDIRSADRRDKVLAAAAAAERALAPLKPLLPMQAIHGDITDDNVVGPRDQAGRIRPDGIIDLGDLTRTWRIGELAITCSSVLHHRPEAPLAILHAVRAFDRHVPLTDAEIAAFWPLMVLRGGALVVSGEHQAKLDPDNPSVLEPIENEWRLFEVAASVPFAVADAALRAALGREPTPEQQAMRAVLAGCTPLFPGITHFDAVDLSSTSEALHAGQWLQPQSDARILAKAAVRSGAAATRYGEFRFTRTPALSAEAPQTCALGIDFRVPAESDAVAPLDCRVVAADAAGLTLDSAAGRIRVDGLQHDLAVGTPLARGQHLGRSDGRGLRVQVCLSDTLAAPRFSDGVHAPAWQRLCPDPSPLLGCALAAPDADADGLLARRKGTFADVQVHYYHQPMRMERGWKQYLVDSDARSYLDMVNNVAAIGHGHPRLAEAVHRQLLTLNTNSRFHYAAIAELSERLVELAPPGLDTVLLVNSGSEAVDLALRMAQTVTGRMDVMAVREAYHGWTLLSDAVTTSVADNPNALATRPDWVHLASAPNAYRGRFRGAEAASGYASEFRALVDDLAARGRPPAAFIAEPVFGNAGGVLLPDGYLAAAYAAVRAHGGLCIADEVQVGYGRLGHRWWAHEGQGVVPDMITIAKAMGNGYPLGAVITTRAIAEAFKKQGSLFSSAGGSPASCVAGLAVLDAIRDEGLQANAARVGDFLLARFAELKARFPLIGAVHGMGLYQGVELVRDRDSLEPASAECFAICERLRELGVVVQPTGERNNVLKIKPPMCLTQDDAEFFVAQLERVLEEGW